MAAPFVAGVAALVARQREPGATAAGSAVVRDRLLNFTDNIAGTGSTWSKGRNLRLRSVRARTGPCSDQPCSRARSQARTRRELSTATPVACGQTARSHTPTARSGRGGEWICWAGVESKRWTSGTGPDCCGERLTDFSIETSLNGTNWSEARTITGEAGVLTSVTFAPPLEARHLRVQLKGTG